MPGCDDILYDVVFLDGKLYAISCSRHLYIFDMADAIATTGCEEGKPGGRDQVDDEIYASPIISWTLVDTLSRLETRGLRTCRDDWS